MQLQPFCALFSLKKLTYMLTKDIELLRKENEELIDKMRKAEEGM